MAEDLISNNFTDSVDGVAIKKTFRLTRIVFIATLIYTIATVLDWYTSISPTFSRTFKTTEEYFIFRIQPLVVLILLGTGIASTLFYVKANKLVNFSFEKTDPDLFNLAYKKYYQAATLSLISFCLSIITTGIKLIILK